MVFTAIWVGGIPRRLQRADEDFPERGHEIPSTYGVGNRVFQKDPFSRVLES